MKCPKCGSENVRIDVLMDVRSYHRGCLGWLMWLFLTVFTGGLILIIPLLTNSKIRTKEKKVGICQDCGFVTKLYKDDQQWWAWPLAILIFLVIISCLNGSNQKREQLDSSLVTSSLSVNSANNKSNIPNRDQEYQNLISEGMTAIHEDRLSYGIKALEDALSIKSENKIIQALNEAYLERGEYFYSTGKTEEAIQDLKKSKLEKVQTLLLIITNSQEKTLLKNPASGTLYQDFELTLQWNETALADYYLLQIQNESWDIVHSEFVYGTSWKNNKINKYGVYYWSVRTHFPNKTWGTWSDKIWFAIKKPYIKPLSITTTDESTKATKSIPSVYYVYITESGSKYHSAGCRYLYHSENRISIDDARARGYTPCKVCHP